MSVRSETRGVAQAVKRHVHKAGAFMLEVSIKYTTGAAFAKGAA